MVHAFALVDIKKLEIYAYYNVHKIVLEIQQQINVFVIQHTFLNKENVFLMYVLQIVKKLTVCVDVFKGLS